MSTQSKACCTVPPVVSDGYKEKGEWITINGMKTYATGPKEAKSALLVVYDIFGFFPQTLQGADILAHSDKDHQYQVFMPGESYCNTTVVLVDRNWLTHFTRLLRRQAR